MKSQTALAIGAGYLLGRTRKMKLALTLAGIGAGKLGGADGLIQQGSEFVRSSPAFNDLLGDVRGQLFDASKQAAASAARGQIDSLSERLLDGNAEPEDSDDTDDTDDTGDGRRSSSSASKRTSSKQPAKKRSTNNRSTSKNSGRQSTKKRPANKRAASQDGSGRSGSRGSSQKRSSSRSTRRS